MNDTGTQAHSVFSLLEAEMKLVAIQSSIAGGDRRTSYEKNNSLYRKNSVKIISVQL